MLRSMVIGLGVLACGASAHAKDQALERTADWPALADAQLAELRGGLRVGGFDLEIGFAVRGWVDGALVVSSELTLVGEAAGAGTPFSSGGYSEGGISFVHELGPQGLQLRLINSENGVALQQDAVLRVNIGNFSERMGDVAARAALATAQELGRAGRPQ